MRGGHSVYLPSVYVDRKGESSRGLRGSHRPSFLSDRRAQDATELYLTHSIAREVTRRRGSADTIIRHYWY